MEDGLVDVSGIFNLVSEENEVYVIILFICQSQTDMLWDMTYFNQIWQIRDVSRLMMFLIGHCSMC